ncbi:MAG TPA: response regulator [Pirellulales bacterium]|nr:response regulator [Pirellulales bacterium]
MNEAECLVLLVEDSPEDTMATLRAFEKAGCDVPVLHCASGDEGLDFLRRRGKYADPIQSPRPTVILLDLNLPGTDGREVLAEIKSDEGLKTIPVIVLTTSTDARDVANCYHMGANSYIQKAVDFEKFVHTIQQLNDYWFHVVLLPEGN